MNREPDAVRKAPFREIYRLRQPLGENCCRWCGLPCEDFTPVRKKRREVHYACDADIQIVTSAEAARRVVFERDKGFCCDCGEDWSERFVFRKGPAVAIWGGHQATRDDPGFNRYTTVAWISLWHVDHRVPLWKVAHMPPLERIAYFLLPNLCTRCEPCHKRKTAKEAAERAHLDELAVPKTAKPRRAWPVGRKMQSRPFQKRKTP